jgi:hypothetical protein
MLRIFSRIKRGLSNAGGDLSSPPRISDGLKGPFTEESLRPVPEGWEVRPPDFIGIASGKAGTSWWYRLLMEHPSVEQNRLGRKELSYFYHFGYREMTRHAADVYRQAFAAPQGAICGEWSPAYLTYPLAVRHLAETVPEAKLLALVRNPVDRVLSAQNQQTTDRMRYMNLDGEREYVFKTFSILQVVLFHSLLFHPFRQLLSSFERSQLLLLQYEKCSIDPAGEIARTYGFLGIDETFSPPSLTRRVNTTPYSLPKLTDRERRVLAGYFHDDVHAFAELFPEIDLSLWPDFC